MSGKTIRVRGVISCAGLWGVLNAGDERDLDADLAESLLRAGHVEAVNPPVMDEKKDEPAPKKRSKRESAS